MADADFALALSLQAEFDKELSGLLNVNDRKSAAAPNISRSIVDPAWDLLDPNPDIRALFEEFNHAYFWGKLSMVEVKWSPRMTLCAGVCSYEGQGGLCSVRLSKPLLSFRPRKDLVETLLIYHTFHDEVNEMRQHWWRCQGPCQTKPPYFGYVRRAMNRAPSSRDFWWDDHQKMCGGTYIKIKEPENYGKKNKKPNQESKKGLNDITSYLSQKDQSDSDLPLKTAAKQKGDIDVTQVKNERIVSTSGNTLGGDRCRENSGRGIPMSSRLLMPHCQQNGLSHAKSNSEKTAEQEPDTKFGDMSDKWGRLLTKKKSTSDCSTTPSKRPKKLSNLEKFLIKLKKRGGKSVNTGAPAFRTIPVITTFSNKAIFFEDSSQDMDPDSKENYNIMERKNKPANSMVKNELGKFFIKKGDHAGSHNAAGESGHDVRHCGTVSSGSVGHNKNSVEQDEVNLKDDDVGFAVQDTFVEHNLTSIMIGSNGSSSVTTSREKLISDSAISEDQYSDLHEPLFRINSKNSKRHLPSISDDDDDDDETLTQLWETEFGSSKKMRTESFSDRPEEEELPEFDMRQISITYQNAKDKSLSVTNCETSDKSINLSSSNVEPCPVKDLSNAEFTSNGGEVPKVKSPGTVNEGSEEDCVSASGSTSNTGDTRENSTQKVNDVSCPICGIMSSAEQINYHLDDCLSIQAISESNWS